MNLVEFLCSVALLCAIRGCQGATSSFSIKQGDFSCGSGGNMRCSGNATTTAEGLLKLTPDPLGRTENYTYFFNTVGVALYNEPVQLLSRTTSRVASLNISFSFRIEAGYMGWKGDGMAFVMFANETWIGSPGEALGAFDREGKAMGKTLAVEFDTYENDVDSDGSHVGIDIASITSEKKKKMPFNLDVDRVYVWIYYSPLRSILQVRVSSNSQKPEQALISYTRNLLDVFEDENVWVGFSGSNGFCECFSYYTVFDMKFESSFGPLLPSSAPSPAQETCQKSSVSTGLIAGVTIGVTGILVGGCLLLCGCHKRRMSRLLSGCGRTPGNEAMAAQEFQLAGLSRSLKMYDYKQLSTADEQF